MKSCSSFLAVSLCIVAASCFSVSHAQDQRLQKRASFERFRRLVKNKAAVKFIEPYTQVSEEEAVRRLIQNGGSMQDVVDLSLEYQLADETARRLIGPGFSPGITHNRLNPNAYTHSRFNDFPIVLKVVKDGVSYVVDLAVQMLKSGKSVGHIIRSLNNVTNADTLEWYKNFASFDSSKLLTSACATYEINACMELMSPATYETYRNTSQTVDKDGKAQPGLYNAYFGAHACTKPSPPSNNEYKIVESCDSAGGSCNKAFNTAYPGSDASKAWDTWVNEANSTDPSDMKVRWKKAGQTVKECNQVFSQNCTFDSSTTTDSTGTSSTTYSKNCKVSIQDYPTGEHLTGESRGNDPSSDDGSKTFTQGTNTVSTRNIYTQLVYTDSADRAKKGAVYRQCDAKVLEMYERIKYQILGAFRSTSGCTSQIYREPETIEDPIW